ncbi:MAG: hypothetical protein CM15mP42_02810 [Methanobacteriota archaeon]|nr:MAG: hypothetical protein CM15mP42_02810 [Euryarchaeota archaeon]
MDKGYVIWRYANWPRFRSWKYKLFKPFNFKIKTTDDYGMAFGYYITVMTEDQEEIDLIFFRCDQNPRKEFPIIVKTLEDSLGLRKLFDSAENSVVWKKAYWLHGMNWMFLLLYLKDRRYVNWPRFRSWEYKLSKPFNFKIKTTRDFGSYFGYYITVMTEDQEEIDLIFFSCKQNPRKEFPIIVKTLEDSLGLRKLFDSAENK